MMVSAVGMERVSVWREVRKSKKYIVIREKENLRANQ